MIVVSIAECVTTRQWEQAQRQAQKHLQAHRRRLQRVVRDLQSAEACGLVNGVAEVTQEWMDDLERSEVQLALELAALRRYLMLTTGVELSPPQLGNRASRRRTWNH
jgi:hypothetical protein